MNRILFVGVLALAGATACVDSDPDTMPDDPTDTRSLIEVQPSCVPDPGDDGDGHDDGAECDDEHTAGPDNICTIVPHPYLYCVTCSDGSSECSSYPAPPES